MYSLILEDKQRHQLIFNQLGGRFQITDIQGLNPPSADINTSEAALIDGEIFNSSKLQMRTVNLAFAIDYDAERSRMEVYRVIHSKKPIRIYYKSEYRDIYIDGYVQEVDFSYFEKKQICTVTIICPQPYLKAVEEIIEELTAVLPLFHFPFASTETPELVFGALDTEARKTVENESELSVGLIIQFKAIRTVSNPKIYNYETREVFGLNGTLQAGDLITVDTSMGEKTITLLRDGIESNAFNMLDKGSTWLQLYPGINEFYIEVSSGFLTDLYVTIKYRNNYEGV